MARCPTEALSAKSKCHRSRSTRTLSRLALSCFLSTSLVSINCRLPRSKAQQALMGKDRAQTRRSVSELYIRHHRQRPVTVIIERLALHVTVKAGPARGLKNLVYKTVLLKTLSGMRNRSVKLSSKGNWQMSMRTLAVRTISWQTWLCTQKAKVQTRPRRNKKTKRACSLLLCRTWRSATRSLKKSLISTSKTKPRNQALKTGPKCNRYKKVREPSQILLH